MIGHDFPYIDTRDLNLDWLLSHMKQILFDWGVYKQAMDLSFENLKDEFDALHDYVQNYFDNLDLTGEVSAKLEEMLADGTLDTLISSVALSMNRKGSNRVFLIIGDSYTDPNRGGYEHGWASPCISYLNKTFGQNAYIKQLGGTGFVGAGQGKTFVNLLNDAIADASIPKASITDIVVAGGCNDKDQDPGQINSAIYNFFNTARQNYPYAQIWVACIGGFLNPGDEWKLAFMERIYENAATYNKMSYIHNGMYCMSTVSCFDSDGIHPTRDGCTRIGLAMSAALEGKTSITPYVNYFQSPLSNPDDLPISYPYGGSHPWYMGLLNGGRYLGLKRNTWVQYGSAVALQNGVKFAIGSINPGFLLRKNTEGTNYGMPSISVPGILQETGKNYYVTFNLILSPNSDNVFVTDLTLELPFVPAELVGKSVSLINILPFTAYLGL